MNRINRCDRSLREEGDKDWLPPLALACEPCCPSGEAERRELSVTDPGGIVCNPKGRERGARPSGETHENGHSSYN